MRVSGEGSYTARVFFVGEHLGESELWHGSNFVGRSSADFNARLNGRELPRREDVWLCNLVREAPIGKKITTEEIARDTPELVAELETVRPAVVVPLGHHATQWFLGPDANLEMLHAIAHEVHPSCPAHDALKEEGTVVFPIYHPAAGLHSPELGARHDYGMQRLGLLLAGKLPGHYADTAGEDYRDATVADVRRLFRRADGTRLTLGLDTEGWRSAPWSLQISGLAGHALVCRSPESIQAFIEEYHHALKTPRLVFHPSLHELPMLSAMGLDVPDGTYDDTSLMAHLLGIEPAGAKPLFFRHAGMRQDAYTDITADAAERLVTDFLLGLVMGERDFRDKAKKPRRKKGDPPPDKVVIGEHEQALRLIDRMLVKEGDVAPLRDRWKTSRAREILQDELEVIGDAPEPTLDDIPLPTAIRYAGRDADGTYRIAAPLLQQIRAMGLWSAYCADLDAVPMLNAMQLGGFGVDVEYFAAFSRELQQEWDQWQWVLDDTIGHALNVNSSPAVGAYLFDTLGLPIKKYTDAGLGSSDDKVLESLRLDPTTDQRAKDVIFLIQEIREIRKIKAAFADAIPQHVRQGRIYPILRLVSTGRPACQRPNLLAFPKHSKRGLRIRTGFRAGEGLRLGSRDLSQIEMRVFAIDCDDPRMLRQFNSGYDFHKVGAAEKLGKRPEDVTKHERFMQKAVNFGILMGITEHGLLDQYHKAGLFAYSLDDLRYYLADWFKQYPRARTYVESKHAEARRYGYVRDMWGRLRYLPGIRSVDRYARAEAERQAQATPTQSGAAGFMKRWMAKVWERMEWVRRHEGWYWRPILWIHDDIVSEFQEDKQAEVERHMQEALDALQWFDIPITSEATAGERWSDL